MRVEKDGYSRIVLMRIAIGFLAVCLFLLLGCGESASERNNVKLLVHQVYAQTDAGLSDLKRGTVVLGSAPSDAKRLFERAEHRFDRAWHLSNKIDYEIKLYEIFDDDGVGNHGINIGGAFEDFFAGLSGAAFSYGLAAKLVMRYNFDSAQESLEEGNAELYDGGDWMDNPNLIFRWSGKPKIEYYRLIRIARGALFALG